jgi:hypothetical protein
MRVFALTVCVTLATLTNARPQHKQVDPGYLRQYYAQIAQTAGEQAAAQGQAAPIYEQQEVSSEVSLCNREVCCKKRRRMKKTHKISKKNKCSYWTFFCFIHK